MNWSVVPYIHKDPKDDDPNQGLQVSLLNRGEICIVHFRHNADGQLFLLRPDAAATCEIQSEGANLPDVFESHSAVSKKDRSGFRVRKKIPTPSQRGLCRLAGVSSKGTVIYNQVTNYR